MTFLRQRVARPQDTPLGPPPRADSSEFVDEDPDTSASDTDNEDSARRDTLVAGGMPGSHTRKRKRLSCRRNMFARMEALENDRIRQTVRATLPLLQPSHDDNSGQESASGEALPLSIMSPTITLSIDSSDDEDGKAGGNHLPHTTTGARHGTPTVTLVDSRPLSPPRPKKTTSQLYPSSSQFDTHGEVLGRLLFTFCRLHPDVPYGRRQLQVAIYLYVTFLETDVTFATMSPSQVRAARKQSRHSLGDPTLWSLYAEEEVFANLETLLLRFSDLQEERVVDRYLQQLGDAVRWADADLIAALSSIGLSPSEPLYSQRWITSLLAGDLKGQQLLACWDYMLAADSIEGQGRPCAPLIHVCAALLLLSRPLVLCTKPLVPHQPLANQSGGLWSDHDGPEPHVGASTLDPDDFVQYLDLFRNYPIDRVGGIGAVLQTAMDLQYARSSSQHQPHSPHGHEQGVELNKFLNDATTAVGRLSVNASLVIGTSLSNVAKAAQTSTARLPSWSMLNAVPTRLWGRAPSSDTPESSDGTRTVPDSCQAGRPVPQAGPSMSDSCDDQASPKKVTPPERDETDRPAAGSISNLQRRLTSLVGSTSTSKPIQTSSHTKGAAHEGPRGPRPLLLSGSGRQVSGSSRDGPPAVPRPSSPGERRTSESEAAGLDAKSPVAGFQMVGSRQAAANLPSRLSPVSRPRSPARHLGHGAE